jgi:hypothetical protein
VNRRTLDILVPIVYVIALVIAIWIGEPGGVGGVAVIGGILVGAYFSAFRRNLKS